MGIYVEGNVIVIEEKVLDLTNAVRLKRLIEELMDKGNEELIISLSGVEILSEAALGVIRRARQIFKNFKLQNASADIEGDLKGL